MKMKRITCFLICTAVILFSTASFAQNKNDSFSAAKTDTSHFPKPNIVIHKRKAADTVKAHLNRIPVHQSNRIPIDTIRKDSAVGTNGTTVQKNRY